VQTGSVRRLFWLQQTINQTQLKTNLVLHALGHQTKPFRLLCVSEVAPSYPSLSTSWEAQARFKLIYNKKVESDCAAKEW